MPTHAPTARPGAPSRPLPRRSGALRRPIALSVPEGPYKLPPVSLERLQRDLGGFRNGPAALALAVFLARHHSMPRRVSGAFPCDRRALVGHRNLDLSESRIRGALETLEKVGFVVRDLVSGSPYHRTEHGLRRKAVLWRFGPEVMPAFLAANARSKAPREASPARRPILPSPEAKRSLVTLSGDPRPRPASLFRSPIGHPIGMRGSLGPIMPTRPAWTPPAPSTAPDPGLAAALDRLRVARAGAVAPGFKMEDRP